MATADLSTPGRSAIPISPSYADPRIRRGSGEKGCTQDPSAGCDCPKPWPQVVGCHTGGMYLALIYDLVEDYVERRAPLREEHLGLARAAHDRGELALAGAFAEPADRALLVWSTDD